jgi:hypothetical protein
LEKVAGQPMPPVEARRYRGLKPAHPGHQIRLRRLDEQVVMIDGAPAPPFVLAFGDSVSLRSAAHQHPGMNAPARAPAYFPERGQETLPIRVVAKNRLPPVTPIENVIDRSG